MGIRLKEEIRQCLVINTLPKEIRKERLATTGSEITRIKSAESNAKADKALFIVVKLNR